MGFLDKVKAKDLLDKAVDTASKNSDKISGGLDKAGEFADKKTKGKYTDKIETGKVKAKQGLDKLASKNAPGGESGEQPRDAFGNPTPGPPDDGIDPAPPPVS